MLAPTDGGLQALAAKNGGVVNLTLHFHSSAGDMTWEEPRTLAGRAWRAETDAGSVPAEDAPIEVVLQPS